ncbi:unnamed protein product, partial [marine sediment metagenome]
FIMSIMKYQKFAEKTQERQETHETHIVVPGILLPLFTLRTRAKKQRICQKHTKGKKRI